MPRITILVVALSTLTLHAEPDQRFFVIGTGVEAAASHVDITRMHTYDRPGPPWDCIGHGTAMAAITGVPLTATVGVRVFNCDETTYDLVLEGIEWVRDNASQGDLVLMTVTRSERTLSTAWEDAIRSSIAKGTTWIVSAGDSDDWTWNHAPANVDEAIVVAAADGLTRQVGSNYGPQVDLFAQYCAHGFCGTAPAAAQVAGAAWYLLQASPWAPAAHIRNLLVDRCSVFDMISPGPGTTAARFTECLLTEVNR